MHCAKQPKAQQELGRRRGDLAARAVVKHYFYETPSRGFWTKNEPSFDSRLLPSCGPLFCVSDASKNRNWHKINELCDYDFKTQAKEIGEWSKYLYFSPHCTEALMDMINVFRKNTNMKNSKKNNGNKKGKHKHCYFYDKELKSKVYQFEASAFRHSILTGNIRVITITNKSGQSIEYLVFAFASHQNHENRLFGLGELNLERNKNKNTDNTNNNNTNNNNENNSKNRNRGRNFNRGKNCKNRKNRNKHANSNDGTEQKWRCVAIFTKSGLMEFFQLFCDFDINERNYFERYILPQPAKYQTPKNAPRFDKNLVIDGGDELIQDLKEKLFNSQNHNNNNINNNSNYGNNRNKQGRNGRKKNKFCKFNKVNHLLEIMEALNIDEYNFEIVLKPAIDRSIKFAQTYDETVLSQVYIDGKFARLYYEYVLYCDIINPNTGKYEKFGLAMMKMNKDNKYVIKGLLTSKMCMDNIGLNNPKTRWTNKKDLKWWNSTMGDKSFSFYDYYTTQRQVPSPVVAPKNSIFKPFITQPVGFVAASQFSTVSQVSPVSPIIPVTPAVSGTHSRSRATSGNRSASGRDRKDRRRKHRGSSVLESGSSSTFNLVQEHGVKHGGTSKSRNSNNSSRNNSGVSRTQIKTKDIKDRVNRLNNLLANEASIITTKTFITVVIKFYEDCEFVLLSMVKLESSSDDKITNKIHHHHKAKIEYVKRSCLISKQERYDSFWKILKLFGELYFPFLTIDYLNTQRLRCDRSITPSVSYMALPDRIASDYQVAKRASTTLEQNTQLFLPTITEKTSSSDWFDIDEDLKKQMNNATTKLNGINGVNTINSIGVNAMNLNGLSAVGKVNTTTSGVNSMNTLNTLNTLNGLNSLNFGALNRLLMNNNH